MNEEKIQATRVSVPRAMPSHHYPESLREGVEMLDRLSSQTKGQSGLEPLRFYYGDVIIRRKPLCPLAESDRARVF